MWQAGGELALSAVSSGAGFEIPRHGRAGVRLVGQRGPGVIGVERGEEFPDEVGAPGADGFRARASALLQAVIDGLEERELTFEFLILLQAIGAWNTRIGEAGKLIE